MHKKLKTRSKNHLYTIDLSSLFVYLVEIREDAHPAGRVGGLSQQTGTEALVDAEAFGANDFRDGINRAGVLFADLHARLDQIERLHDASGSHAGNNE